MFVKTIASDRASLSVAASHELVEMLVDPAINMLTTGPDPKAAYAYEAADPVEAESLAFSVNGFKMTDFIYPSYFEIFRKPGSTKFDYRGKVKGLPGSRWWLPDRVQEWQVEPDHGVGTEGTRAEARGPATAPQRNPEETHSPTLYQAPPVASSSSAATWYTRRRPSAPAAHARSSSSSSAPVCA